MDGAHSKRGGGSRPDAGQTAAFTLTELLVIIATLALLVVMLLPAHAASQSKSSSVRCMDNLRQVIGAVLMYTHDYHDLMPPNEGSINSPGYSWFVDWVYGPPPYEATTSPTTFNPDSLTDPTRCMLITYLGTNTAVFRCTADPRRGTYSGTNAALAGTIVPATRTISMNCAVGTVCTNFYNGSGSDSGLPNLATFGPFLGGYGKYGNQHNAPWRTYGKTADMVAPAPANLFVITEEDPFSINDCILFTSVQVPEWVDWPSTLHNMACVVSFADGHVELHKWLSPSTRLTQPAGTAAVSASNPDWNWVAQRTSAWAH